MLLSWCATTTGPIASLLFTKKSRRTMLWANESGKIGGRDRLDRRTTNTKNSKSTHSQSPMKAFYCCMLTLALSMNAHAKLVTKTVSYEQNGTKLEGYLAYNDSATEKGKVPGVVVFPEWWGLNDYIKSRAEQLANMVYGAFAADMYGDGQSTTEPAKAKEFASKFYGKPLMAERAQAALDQLLKTGMVDESKVAAIGFCFGGATSLALAYTGAPLAGVVTLQCRGGNSVVDPNESIFRRNLWAIRAWDTRELKNSRTREEPTILRRVPDRTPS